jgi:hypothetical protein
MGHTPSYAGYPSLPVIAGKGGGGSTQQRWGVYLPGWPQMFFHACPILQLAAPWEQELA